jgi:hypothetical protein
MMQKIPRRENGITTRYLAQTIINDAVFPDQAGIQQFVDSLENYHHVDKPPCEKLNYYFFLHLEDFGVEDKSEIDLVFWSDSAIFLVEVKGFTDANSPGVKKEIIRNYLHIDNLRKRSKFYFHQNQEIYPVLLYSESYQNWKRGSNTSPYFNDKFLLTKGRYQTMALDAWDRGNYPIPDKYCHDDTFMECIESINKKLFFITWDNVYKIHEKLNRNEVLTNKIAEMMQIRDSMQADKDIFLISR